MKAKIFLGGTCNGSTWREKLKPMLTIDWFDPVVEDWTPECQAEEYRQKEEECNIHLYVITSGMTGVFSIAEAVDSAWRPGVRAIFFVDPDGFSRAQMKSFEAVGSLIASKGGSSYTDNWTLSDLAMDLNNMF